MSVAGRVVQACFNYAYNPVYDLTTGQLNIYRKLHEKCVGRLDFKDKERVLCVGVGTGNEIIRILQINNNVSIVGIDYSRTALRKAYQKALAAGKEIETLIMDARHLQFPAESFDKVLCIHLTDFVEESEDVTDEIVRVLKPGGQFVITYPSKEEDAKLVSIILKDCFCNNTGSRNYVLGVLAFLAQMSVAILYLPIVFRKKRHYSRQDLQVMFAGVSSEDFQIEEYPIYQDFIVYGKKSTKGGLAHVV